MTIIEPHDAADCETFVTKGSTMKINFCKVLCFTVLLGIGFTIATDFVGAQENTRERADRRTVRPPTFAPTQPPQREPSAVRRFRAPEGGR